MSLNLDTSKIWTKFEKNKKRKIQIFKVCRSKLGSRSISCFFFYYFYVGVTFSMFSLINLTLFPFVFGQKVEAMEHAWIHFLCLIVAHTFLVSPLHPKSLFALFLLVTPPNRIWVWKGPTKSYSKHY